MTVLPQGFSLKGLHPAGEDTHQSCTDGCSAPLQCHHCQGGGARVLLLEKLVGIVDSWDIYSDA